MNRLRVAPALALMILAVGCGAPKAAEDAPAAAGPVAVEVGVAVQRPMRRLVEASGSFVASQGGSARLTASVPGRVSQVMVKEGDLVRRGQLLAILDSSVQSAQQSAAQSALVAANQQSQTSDLTAKAAAADQVANVATAEATLRATRAEQESAVAQARFNWETASADLNRTNIGARPQELTQAHQATVQARIARDRANQELTRAEGLSTEGFASRRQLEEARAAAKTAESALKAAEASESLIKEGARPEERRAAEVRLNAARDLWQSARRVSKEKIAQAETALKQAQEAQLTVEAKRSDAAATASLAKQKSAELAVASATTHLSTLVAPFDGRVSRRSINPGDFADTTTPAFEIISDKSAVDFIASLPASEASELRIGMSASTSDDDRGKVVNISAADAQTGLCAVRIVSNFHALPGTFGTAKIVLASLSSALAVPKNAVVEREGKSVVFAVEGDVVKLTEVTTGAVDGDWIQITKGLAAGKQVVTLGQSELADGSKIKPSKAEAKE